MITLDLSPYLIELYVHSRKIADWENRQYELDAHLRTIETWWQRHKDVGDPLPSALAYMMLAHLHMLKGYVFMQQQTGYDSDYYERLFRVEAQILEQFSHANEAVERMTMDMAREEERTDPQ